MKHLNWFRWCFCLGYISLSIGCGGGPTTDGNAVTNTSTSQTNSAAAEKAAALETATALQDAANQAQEAALQKFGTVVFGQSTFR